MVSGFRDMREYVRSCESVFWKAVFDAELRYIVKELKSSQEVLSVGCGPAIIESGLAEHGFRVTGLDISKEALDEAGDSVRTVEGSAETMGFEDGRFDAVMYVASLQFIQNYEAAIEETARVLRPRGRILVMLLNPESQFFKRKRSQPDSYVNRIRHESPQQIERTIAKFFDFETEFFLGIDGDEIFESNKPGWASLYVVKGTKKALV
jgi:ubiquinone/menaquinone biosynthesis C-methylase UbiE